MERLHEVRRTEFSLLDCTCNKLPTQSSLQKDNRISHRTQEICYRSYNYSLRKPFYQQAMW